MKQYYTNNTMFVINLVFSKIESFGNFFVFGNSGKKAAFVFYLILMQSAVFGATITSVNSGNWSSGSTWSGGVVPTAADDVTIASGTTVAVNSNISAKIITINGVFVVSGDRTVTGITGMVMNGDLTFGQNNSTLTFPLNTNIVINAPGGIKAPADTNCSANVAIFIGMLKLAACVGNSTIFNFETFNTAGGTISSNPTSNSPVCSSGQLTITAGYIGSKGSSFKYRWSIKDPNNSTITTDITEYPATGNPVYPVNNPIVGTYEASLILSTIYGDITYENTKKTIVTVTAAPNAGTLTGTEGICVGGNITFSSNGNTSGSWSSNSPEIATVNSTSGFVTGVSAGTARITYTVTGTGGCSNGIATRDVTVNPKPVAPTSSAQIFCSVDSKTVTDLIATGAEIKWYNATTAGTQFAATAVLATATYYASQTTNGCESARTAVSVTVNPIPTPTFTVAPAANSCPNSDVIYTTQSGMTNYSWTVGGVLGTDYSITSGGIGTNNNTVTLKWLTSGNKTVTVNYTSTCSGGTAASNTTAVVIAPNNVSNGFSATIICTGESPTLTFDADNSTYSTPYRVTYKSDDAPAQYSVLVTSKDNFSFTPEGYNLNSNTGYSLVSISNATCTNSVFSSFKDSGANLIIRPIPVATVSGSRSLCVGAAPSNITFTNPQTVAVTVTYKINEGADQTVSINASSSSNIAVATIAVATSIAGIFVYKLVGVRYQSEASCPNIISGSPTVTVTVSPNNTSSVASSTPTLCINTVLTNITHSTTGAVGIGTATGLPAGVTAAFGSNTITISGTPTASGTFNYSIPLTGGCGTVNATGTIAVSPNNTSSVASSTPTLCINTVLTNITHSTTGAVGIGTATGLPAGVTAAFGSNTITISGTPTASGTFNYSIPLTGGCGTVNATGTIAVSPNNTSSVASSTPTLCINTVLTNITHTTTGATGIGTATGLPAGVTAAFGSNTITISGTPTASGTFNYSIPLTGGCSTVNTTGTITVTPNLPASVSVAVSPTGAICAGTWVTFTATSTNGGATPTYQWYNGATLINGESAATYATNSLVNADAIKVIMTSNASPCLIDSPASSDPITMIVPAAAVWTGSSWTNGPPTYPQAVIFNETYNSEGDMQACSCQVNAGVVTIKSGHALKITNGIAVSSGSLIFENNASLVQINDAAVNVGAITYQRATTPILDTDYVYWSSPVAGAKLGAIQTATLYYSFYALGNSWVRAYSTTPMAKGIGYIVRGAGTGLSSGPRLARTATFTGVPNNGINDVNIIAGKSNLIGNPYPSAIDADAFLTANKEALQGTLYFWTHQSAIQSAGSITTGTAGSGAYAYTSGDYASYNFTGDVSTSVSSLTGGVAPSGKIAAGQSFLATGSSSGGIATCKNSMRLSKGGETLDNTQFLRTASGSKTSKVTTMNEIEKSRVWLNLSNTQGAFKQMMIGYVTGATNDYDKRYDAVSLNGNAYIDFYSVDNDSLLTIQGRALPIPETDAVPLGFSSAIEGDFTIAIDKTDGLLMGMDVFLEDKKTNTFTNLKAGGYTFSTKKGTYNDRFVLGYTNKTLATADFKDLNYDVLISIKNEIIKIKSKVQLIDKVMVFDVSGKLMLEKKNIENTESILSGTNLSKQLYVIKVFLKDGKIISEKIIY